jgi:hypothetical protein
MVNCGGSEKDSACCRMILWAMAWNVPPQIRPPVLSEPAPADPAAARASMSLAARRVKVSSRIRPAGTPWPSRSQAARATSVRVFPVPAPASTSSGPP